MRIKLLFGVAMNKITPIESYKQHYANVTRLILARSSSDSNDIIKHHELAEQAIEYELSRLRESLREHINRTNRNK